LNFYHQVLNSCPEKLPTVGPQKVALFYGVTTRASEEEVFVVDTPVFFKSAAALSCEPELLTTQQAY
jgi:hypothetical protein